MLAKSLTSRDFLRIRCSELLNDKLTLSKEARWEQALSAKTVRNFWFTATSRPNPPTAGTAATGAVVNAQTQSFAEPVIVTDILSMFDFKIQDAAISAMVSRYLLEITQIGSGDAASGVNLFGLTGAVGAEFITKHEKNYSNTLNVMIANAAAARDVQAKWLPFVPRLLRPYDFIQARWQFNLPLQDVPIDGYLPQLGFRSVRVMPVDSPYRYIGVGPEKRIKGYINASEPETFLLEIKFPFANIPALGTPSITVKTPQQGRPLLILGACSNLEGVQAALREEQSYYNFTSLDPAANVSKVPQYTFVPMALWAANSDFRNTNMYNMWPVPHLLEPDSQLQVEIVNGLYPFFNPAGGFFQNVATTRSSQDVRITFICRTV